MSRPPTSAPTHLPPFSIVGNWVASFTAWYPNSSTDLVLPFTVANKFAGWATEDDWKAAWAYYFERPPDPSDADYDGHVATLGAFAVLNPVPVATLSCFQFKPDGTLNFWGRTNNLEYPSNGIMTGSYTTSWYSHVEIDGWPIDIEDMNAPGGTIYLDEIDRDTGNVKGIHATLYYLMVSDSELKFIISHGPTMDVGAPSGAGTMNRIVLDRSDRPPAVNDPPAGVPETPQRPWRPSWWPF